MRTSLWAPARHRRGAAAGARARSPYQGCPRSADRTATHTHTRIRVQFAEATQSFFGGRRMRLAATHVVAWSSGCHCHRPSVAEEILKELCEHARAHVAGSKTIEAAGYRWKHRSIEACPAHRRRCVRAPRRRQCAHRRRRGHSDPRAPSQREAEGAWSRPRCPFLLYMSCVGCPSTPISGTGTPHFLAVFQLT